MSDPSLLQAENDTLRAALAKAEEDLAALRMRYEDWRPISEAPDEYHRNVALIHFYMPATADDDVDTWITRTWSERPAHATHWCLIVSPLGPRGDQFGERT